MAKGRKTGGRKAGTPNKSTHEIKELAGALVPGAIAQLGKLLNASGTGEGARLRAIEVVFERAFGRAPQAVQHSGAIGTFDLTHASDDDVIALEAILARIANIGAGTGGDSQTGN